MSHAERVTCRLPDGVKARVWMKARCFYSRDSAQSRCWLWLLREAGTLDAVHLPAIHAGSDDHLQAFIDELDAHADEPKYTSATFGEVVRLSDAPAVPLPRWAISWGHPFQQRLRAFAAALDAEILEVLGELEAPGPFLGSVENYNRLASLPPAIRERRIQALKDFPPLVVPLLLRTQGWPSLLPDQYEDREPGRRAGTERPCPPTVLDAIDRGRDLIGALADHYRVGRALIRSAPLRSPWRRLDDVRPALRLLENIPAEARPRNLASFETWWPAANALPVPQSRDASQHTGRLFAKGWDTTWETTGLPSDQVTARLRDCRDFLAAAAREVPASGPLVGVEPDVLGLAWLARRGLQSLLGASERWHAQPMERVAPRETPVREPQLPPILNDWSDADRHACERLTPTTLVEEGREMSHCVGDYWHRCLRQGDRIVRLTLANGEQATAHLALSGVDIDGPRYTLEDVRGHANAESSIPMWQWAQQVEHEINSPGRETLRRQALRSAREATQRADAAGSGWSRPFDRRSRAELKQVLAWLRTHRDAASRGDVLLEDFVAGTGYSDISGHMDELVAGDPLALVREPHNPHDRDAIRIEWSGRKVGYVSHRSNAPLARLLDRGVLLEARLTRVGQGGHKWPSLEFQVRRPTSPAAPCRP